MNGYQQDGPGWEVLFLALAGGLALAAGILWVTTGLAALLSGQKWPHIPADQLAHALLALPSHFAEPREIWPSRLRHAMPGALAFYAALAVTVVAALVVGIGVRRMARSRPNNSDRRERGARWGTGRELHRLHQDRTLLRRLRWRETAGTGRLGLGYRGRRLLRGEARHALVLFGPPQSGKSAGIAIPALLEWQGPAVASSIKTDLLAASVHRRAELGEVLVFDPYGLSRSRGATWSPLRLARSWDGALSTALRFSAAAELDTATVKGGNYWLAAAEQRLAPLLWAAAQTGAGISAVVRWAYGQGDAELPPILHRLLEQAADPSQLADAQAAYDAHAAFEALAGETRGSIESTVQMLLRGYRSPRVQASAAGSDITAERLLGGSHTLYLIGDSHRSRLLRPIFLTLLQELVDHAFHAATIAGGRLERPLLLCLDELGNVAPLPNLAEVASTAPSHNIQLISIFHDIAQARSRYGDQVQTVINSHRARMLLPGVGDLETLRYFSDLLGERIRRPRSPDGLRGASSPPEREPLAAPQQLRQLSEGQALLVYGHLAPVKLRLRTYFANRQLRGLADLGPTAQASGNGSNKQ